MENNFGHGYDVNDVKKHVPDPRGEFKTPESLLDTSDDVDVPEILRQYAIISKNNNFRLELAGLKKDITKDELLTIAKKCDDHINKDGQKPDDFKKLDSDYQEWCFRAMSDLYRDSLMMENDYNLPYSKEELNNIKNKFGEKGITDLADYIAQYDRNVKLQKQEKENEAIDGGDMVYSTSRPKKEEKKDAPLIKINYAGANTWLGQKIKEIEDVAYGDGSKSARERAQEVIERIEKRLEGQRIWERGLTNVPELTDYEKKVDEKCYNYLRHPKKNRKEDSPELKDKNEEMIKKGAQEWLALKDQPKKTFREGKYKGQRQLFCEEVFNDENGNKKTIKYIYDSKDKPAGDYYFEPNSSMGRVAFSNPNLMIVPVNFVLEAEERPKANVKKKQS
jgi:hypothetical protein